MGLNKKYCNKLIGAKKTI